MFAGAARRSLAPDSADLAAGVYLGGFGAYRQRRATGILDPPECRVIAVSDRDTVLVLAVLDLVGASGPLLAAIRRAASAATGVPPSHILIACTHSHASPDAQGLWGGMPPAYAERLASLAAETIAAAVRGMAPATATAATTAFTGLVRNRRDWPQTDTTLTVMRFASPSGGTIATLSNYACHPTAIGPQSTEVSRDWCGFAADVLEREVGGVAVYVNGAVGDANPLFAGEVQHARTLGTSVAAWAIEALQGADAAGDDVVVRTEPLELPVDAERLREGVLAGIALSGVDDAGVLAGALRAGDAAQAAAGLHEAGRPDLAQLAAAVGMMLERQLVERDGRTYVATHCGYARVAGVEAFAAPGEMLTRLALPLRSSLRSTHRMLFGLTHDTLGYFVPEDEWMRGRNSNYEESVSMGSKAGTLLQARLLESLPAQA